MAKYQYYFFDLDGTLVNTEEGITNSVKYVLEKYHIKEYDMETLRKFIGPPLGESFQKYFGFSAEETGELIGCYREYYSAGGMYEAKVYGGIDRLLERLKEDGKVLAVATSKPEHFARKILERFGLADYFTCIAGASMDGSRSSKEDVIAYALAQCEVTERARVVMIGDREHDIYGAGKQGLDSVGVLFGFGSRKELEAAGADYIVNTPDEIMNI
ncbi:MAG: HAD family hydrolase [Dorea sp.]|jgi:phosphoglycolate phosphatase|nr:HAD family hydrolase [Dorea sp.]